MTTDFYNKVIQDEDTIQMMLAAIGFDASKKEIDHLLNMEQIINVNFPEETSPFVTTLLPFGVHVGNVLIENIPGAYWDVDNIESPFDMRVVCPSEGGGTYVARPIKRMHTFWNDRTDTIYGWVNMIIKMNAGQMDDMEDNEWVDQGDGTMVRKISFSLEDIDNEEKLQELSERMGKTITKDDILQMLQGNNNVH